jgi:hypothetical protein
LNICNLNLIVNWTTVRWIFLNWINRKKFNLIFEFLDDCVNDDGVVSEENKLPAQDNKGI